VEELMELGFGKCKLQVQVPEKGPIQVPRELIGKNIVTSFTLLASEYFARLEEQVKDGVGSDNAEERGRKEGGGGSGGVGELNLNALEKTTPRATPRAIKVDGTVTRIKYVGGSVEAACALGVADGIVDLVESGETMRAAGLKPIATILTTGAVLIKSKHPSNPTLVKTIESRIRGVIVAKKYVLCTYNISRDKLAAVTKVTPGKRAPTITQLDEYGWVSVSAMVEKSSIATVMDRLEETGAEDILVTQISNSRSCGNVWD
jgi:ATP phosphoribosyltransferase